MTSAIPGWIPLLLGLIAVATWLGAAMFALNGSSPIALACAALAFLFTYVTLWLIVHRSRSHRQNDRLTHQIFQFMPLVSAGAAVALVVAAALSWVWDYGYALSGLFLLGAGLLGAWAVWAPLEVKRMRRRFGDRPEGSPDSP